MKKIITKYTKYKTTFISEASPKESILPLKRVFTNLNGNVSVIFKDRIVSIKDIEEFKSHFVNFDINFIVVCGSYQLYEKLNTSIRSGSNVHINDNLVLCGNLNLGATLQVDGFAYIFGVLSGFIEVEDFVYVASCENAKIKIKEAVLEVNDISNCFFIYKNNKIEVIKHTMLEGDILWLLQLQLQVEKVELVRQQSQLILLTH